MASCFRWYQYNMFPLSSPRSFFSSPPLFQRWTQGARRHHLHQRPADLVSDRRQRSHQEGRQPENSRAPWKRGRHPHRCSRGDRPLTFHQSCCRSCSYVLLITSGPYSGGGASHDSPSHCSQRPVMPHNQENSGFALKGNDCGCSKSGAVLPRVFFTFSL